MVVDFNLQRLNMVESQVRPSELTDRRITAAMLEVHREAYLPAALKGVAYSDGELALGGIEGSVGTRGVLAPRTIAQMIQSLDLDPGDIVLLVGAGSGYEAALLSHIAQTVIAVEVDAGLAQWSEQALQGQDVGNVGVVHGAMEEGVANEGPFDAILINGCVDQVPDAILDQLKDGARLVAVRRSGGVARIVRVQRSGELFPVKELSAANAQMLPGFETAAAFVF